MVNTFWLRRRAAMARARIMAQPIEKLSPAERILREMWESRDSL